MKKNFTTKHENIYFQVREQDYKIIFINLDEGGNRKQRINKNILSK